MEIFNYYFIFLKKYKILNILFAILSIREPVSLLLFFWVLGQGLGLSVKVIFLIILFTIPIFYSLYSIRNFKDILCINNNYTIVKLILLIIMNFLLYSFINIGTLLITTKIFGNN